MRLALAVVGTRFHFTEVELLQMPMSRLIGWMQCLDHLPKPKER